MESKERQSLEEILQSVSDVLFPDQLGKEKVALNSKDADGDTPLHVVVRRGDNDGTELLIEAGADINATGDMGETPLHVAITSKNLKVIQMLVKAGARTNIKSEFNETAKEKAMKMGGEIAKLLE